MCWPAVSVAGTVSATVGVVAGAATTVAVAGDARLAWSEAASVICGLKETDVRTVVADRASVTVTVLGVVARSVGVKVHDRPEVVLHTQSGLSTDTHLRSAGRASVTAPPLTAVLPLVTVSL